MIEQLRKDGIVFCPWNMPQWEIQELDKYLDRCTAYNAHIKNKGNTNDICYRAKTKPNWPCFSVSMQDIVIAPYFFEYALKGFTLAKEYFAEPPLLYSMNCFWTQPAKSEYKDTHDWHRDGDDRKQLVMFMYGTDVDTIENGAHKYQLGSHNLKDSELGYPFREPPEDKVLTILAKAGTCFFVDTWGMHMGVRPDKLRMLCWARWGVSDPPESYKWDQLAPVPKKLLGDRYPKDSELQESIRLVVA